ncbi:unnamed protein product, partial [Ectocarpus sp. 8 AP-2014]
VRQRRLLSVATDVRRAGGRGGPRQGKPEQHWQACLRGDFKAMHGKQPINSMRREGGSRWTRRRGKKANDKRRAE